jgi:cytochrome c-type biogenesis protein CcmH/NrfG
MRNIPAAEGAFREATRLDPQRSEAWVMLARIAAATRGSDAAREVIAEALAASPRDEAIRQLAAELGPVP